jgi:hypothetical protein
MAARGLKEPLGR